MTIEGIEAYSILARVKMYRPGDTQREMFHQFYSESYGAIDNGDGNLVMSGGFGETVDNALEEAVLAVDGDATEILLRIIDLFDTSYQFQYKDGDDEIQQVTIEGSLIDEYLFDEIADFVFDELSITALEPLILLQMANADAIGATTDERTMMIDLAEGILEEELLNDIIYTNLFVGNSEIQRRKGFLNPDVSLTPGGSPQSHADGVSILNDSGGEYYEMNFAPGDGIMRTHPFCSVGFYHKVATASAVTIAAGGLTLITNDAGDGYALLSGDAGASSATYLFIVTGTEKGDWVFKRRDEDEVKVYNENSLLATKTQDEGGFGSNKVRISIRSGNSGRGVFCMIDWTCDISDAKQTAWRNLKIAAMTTLNREA